MLNTSLTSFNLNGISCEIQSKLVFLAFRKTKNAEKKSI